METRPIPGFGKRYSAREDGVIIGPSDRPIVGTKDRYGYRRTTLRDERGKKNHMIHSLICSAWHGERPKGLDCGHLDGDKDNNRPENLRWITRSENHFQKRLHGTSDSNRTKMPLEKYLLVAAGIQAGLSKRAISKAVGVSMSIVSAIRVGRVGKRNRAKAAKLRSA